MKRQVYSTEELRDVLHAAQEARAESASTVQDREALAYEAGYNKALRVVATAVGVAPFTPLLPEGKRR
jgi:hypothetical protein